MHGFGGVVRIGESILSKTCDANKHLQRKYGITLSDYDELLRKQGGCAICGVTEPGGRFNKHFHVDHDHQTGKIRGLLCYRCNTSIGAFGDSAELLRHAVKYLEVSV